MAPLHIIDIEDSEEEELNAGLVADQVEVDVVVPDKVEKVVDYTITLHQKCTLWDGKGGKRMVVMKTVFFTTSNCFDGKQLLVVRMYYM